MPKRWVMVFYSYLYTKFFELLVIELSPIVRNCKILGPYKLKLFNLIN